MVQGSWKDINSPGAFSFSKKSTKEQVAEVDYVDPTPQPVKKAETEVRLSDPQWAKGPDGYLFNKKARASVKVEFLKETIKKRVVFELFVESEAGRENLNHQAEAFESNGRAEADLTLFYGEKYHDILREKPDTPCRYIFKASHSSGEKTIESGPLELPYFEKQRVDFVEIADLHFNHGSAVPVIDSGDSLLGSIVGALKFAQDNAGKELVICGHSDTSGEHQQNQKLSEQRATAIKALIDNDIDGLCSIAQQTGKVEDYQGILETLTTRYGWECSPGSIDNAPGPKTQNAVKQFQAEYNEIFESDLSCDGKVGPKTWRALFTVVQDILAKKSGSLRKVRPQYGEGGTGIVAFGETRPVEEKERANYKSKRNRRVELVFKDPSVVIRNPLIMDPIIIQSSPAVVPAMFEICCSHESKGEKRLTKSSGVLEIVPDMLVADNLKIKYLGQSGSAEEIKWEVKGYFTKEFTGTEITVPVRGWDTQVKDLFWLWVLEHLREKLVPKTLRITCSDKENRVLATGKVRVFPHTTEQLQFDFKKQFPSFSTLLDGLDKSFDYLKAKKPKFEYLVGKASASFGFKEDSSLIHAYEKVTLQIGFDPLISLTARFPIPIQEIACGIPSGLTKFLLHVYAFIEVGGKLTVNGGFETTGIHKCEVNGKLSGSISGSIGLAASIGNGKILAAEASIAVSIVGTGTIYMQFTPEREIGIKYSVKLDDVKGIVKWKLFDSKITHQDSMVIKKAVDIIPEGKRKFQR